MSVVLLLTNAPGPSAESFPSLGLLTHTVRVAPLEASALLDAPPVDVILVDGRRDSRRPRPVPPPAHDRSDGAAARGRHRGRAGRGDRRLGRRRRAARHAPVRPRSRRGCGWPSAGSRPPAAPPRPASSAPATCRSTRPPTPPSSAGGRSTSRSRSSSCSSTSRSTRAGSSPAPSCCRRSGATTTSAAPARSTCTSGGCGPSSAPSTSR